MNVAFFGTGLMGAPMAQNLLKSGHAVAVYDLNPALTAPLVAAGARLATSPADAAEGADAVVSMLPHDAAVRGLYLGDTGLLRRLPKGTLVVDCSTVSAECAKDVSAAAHAHGLAMIDAPVSGGVAGAAAGTLSFLCGGSADDLGRARPLLDAMGKNVMHAGGAGAGAVAKICNNMLLAIHMIGTCEALQLGVDNGLDPGVLSELMLKSSGRNWSLELYNPFPGVMETAPASRGYSGGFQVALMNKDLGLAMEAAQKSHSATPLGALAKQLYALHMAQGKERLDFSSILQLLQHDR
ncbi:MAG TPA: 3-hydroxyisobutyrate dehydrogenase [Moraxellaceae bacterium]|nr:3-hydroxyisobutyrate dehydrogenase [Moraxellaceae bacterium]